jgi:site-specific recombinase XerD
LIAQRRASTHTINSYRDTFRLLLKFAERQLGCPPYKLTLENLPAPFLAAFLDHLEATRANGPRTRNLRLAAIRSFFRYAALEAPQHAALIQRVLAIPRKRYSRPLIDFLTRPEIEALLEVVNICCSRAREADDSVPTRSSISWPNTNESVFCAGRARILGARVFNAHLLPMDDQIDVGLERV